MYLISHEETECCGCTACEQICHHGALKMVVNTEGFIYPLKDEDKCINCGLCEKVCPYNKLKEKKKETSKVYAGYAKSVEERKKSSSGALFYIIAKQVIEQGGIVYGAILDNEMQVHHVSAESVEELQLLRGSKYVQSKLNNTYKEIKNHLKSGRLVYFTGVGCQVAGLKSFLIKDYSNLLTSDLICHGCPNQKLFDAHISYLEKKYHGKVENYQFRDNALWGGCESVTIVTDSQTRKTYRMPSYSLSPYLYSFMQAMTYRMSCYECPFASVPRQGDITLGDFWGVNKFVSGLQTMNGVSLILANTTKGKEVIESLGQELIIEESDIKAAAAENKNLITHTIMPKIRKNIFKEIQEKGYPQIAKTIFRPSAYYYYKQKVFYNIIDIIGWKNYKKIRKIIRK